METTMTKKECSVCGEPVQEGAHLECCIDGCEKVLCPPCVAGIPGHTRDAPLCYACRSHTCPDHITTIADVEVCVDCAKHPSALRQLVRLWEASMRSAQESHQLKMDKYAKRIEAANRIAARLRTGGD
jgi:hypothetical protein